LWKDERKDPKKSTQAAARYLLELYDRFDNWPLALAAYNAGPTKLSRAIKRCGSRDFFQLHTCGRLKKETANFVSKFIALTMIARNPKDYDFEEPRRL
jgi:membrane-bound lytic murein transglycosylase D